MRAVEDCRHREAMDSAKGHGKSHRVPVKPIVRKRCKDCGHVQDRYPDKGRCLNMVETVSGREICCGELEVV